MNKEDNHIIIEVLNSNGDIKLTKKRNPRALWQNYNYPDEYIFKDVDYVNIFSLIQENKKLKKEKEHLQERIDKTIKYVESLEYDDYGTGYYDIGENHYDKLLEILKGSNK